MKSTSITNAIAVFSCLAEHSEALPWPPSFSHLKDNFLYKRQDSDSIPPLIPSDVVQQSSAANGLSLPPGFATTPTTSNEGFATTGFVSSGSFPTPTGPTTTFLSSSTRATITSIPVTAPAGGLNFIQPNTAYGGSQYYFIGQSVTWIWNYTSLLVPPSHIDILATLSSTAGVAAPTPYTLTTNMTFQPTVTFEWDLGAFAAQTPLAVGLYRLEVFDADNTAGVNAFPSPGKLAPAAPLQFGVYTNALYPAPSGIVCITCNAAGGKTERLALGTMGLCLSITLGTMISFTGLAGIW